MSQPSSSTFRGACSRLTARLLAPAHEGVVDGPPGIQVRPGYSNGARMPHSGRVLLSG
jgi:hypothetical protein